jgi:hypothetical protein
MWALFGLTILAALLARVALTYAVDERAVEADLYAQVSAILPNSGDPGRGYVIDVGDILSIDGPAEVAGHNYSVDADGTAPIGDFGAIRVAGLTIDEAQDAIAMQLAKFFDRPSWSVDVDRHYSKVDFFVGFGPDPIRARVPLAEVGNVFAALARVKASKGTADLDISIRRHRSSCISYSLPVDLNTFSTRGPAAIDALALECGDDISIFIVTPMDKVRAGWDKVLVNLEWCLSSLSFPARGRPAQPGSLPASQSPAW